ncbi:formin-like protein 2 [Tanacetum coccineum]
MSSKPLKMFDAQSLKDAWHRECIFYNLTDYDGISVRRGLCCGKGGSDNVLMVARADIKRSRDMVADEYVSQAVIEHDDAIQHVEEISKKKYILKLNAHQNIAILLRPLNVTIEDVCDALLQGNSDTLGTELLASLLMMDPRTNTGTLSAGFFTLRWKLGSCPNWSVADMTLDKVVDYIKRETNQFFHCS